MYSFRNQYLQKMRYSPNLTNMIARVAEYKGKEHLYAQQQPEILKQLQQVAMIQSTESSNRIEGIEISSGRLEKFLRDNLEPKDRTEAEIAGYRDVLDTIHANYEHIPLKPSVILQFHRDLMMRWSSQGGGHWKKSNNDIRETFPDGSVRIRFQPLDFSLVASAMDELCERFIAERERGEIPSLVLIAAFVFDFLSIHPFTDGNGRMARLLTLLLLYQSGYRVGKYISLEKVVEDTKDRYYATLYKSSQDWHSAEHDLSPWIEYFMGVMLEAYSRFEERVDIEMHPKGRDWKAKRVRNVIEHLLTLQFTLAEIEDKCPGVSRATIRKTLHELRDEGLIQNVGQGRNAKWRKIGQGIHPGE